MKYFAIKPIDGYFDKLWSGVTIGQDDDFDESSKTIFEDKMEFFQNEDWMKSHLKQRYLTYGKEHSVEEITQMANDLVIEAKELRQLLKAHAKSGDFTPLLQNFYDSVSASDTRKQYNLDKPKLAFTVKAKHFSPKLEENRLIEVVHIEPLEERGIRLYGFLFPKGTLLVVDCSVKLPESKSIQEIGAGLEHIKSKFGSYESALKNEGGEELETELIEKLETDRMYFITMN